MKAGPRMADAYLMMEGITKLYPATGVLANDGVDFEVRRGEIHALVGENGAGKSTLMKILDGLEASDAGRIRLRGEEVTVRSPADAGRLGIGMVHQHFRLIPELTIAENVVLGLEPRRARLFLDGEEAVRRVREVTERHGFHIDPRLRVGGLSAGQMQLVEILKVLYRRADLLILDEPTAVLIEREVGKLFHTLRALADRGRTVILISHKLAEVKAVSDRITVMRRGRVVAVRESAEVDERELSRLMMGRSVRFPPPAPAAPGRVVFELREVSVREKGRDHPPLDRVSLHVRAGEIVGVTGVGGNGLAELEDVASGLRRPSAGAVLHDGEDVTRAGVAGLRRRGLAYVPSNRLQRGASLPSSLTDNLIVTRRERFLRAGVFSARRIREYVRELQARYSLAADPRQPLGTLSGGTIQKAILARELTGGGDFAVFSEPTWGLDVAGGEFVHGEILALRGRGAAILLLSSDLDEVLRLADRVAVLYRGRIVTEQTRADGLQRERIGEYMTGLREDGR